MKINFKKKAAVVFLIVFLLAAALLKTSFSAENENVILESTLEKYVNYSVDDKQGTLVQYNVKAGIEYTGDYTPIRSTSLTINLKQIDGLFPDSVEVISNSTKVTNGIEENITPDYNYDSNTGIININVSNQNEDATLINNNQPSKDDRDSYTIICNYNTYNDQADQRDISLDINYAITLDTKDNRVVEAKNTFENLVTENISDVISLLADTDEIYNGSLKSNVLDGTSNTVEYNETNHVVISKKDIVTKLEINQQDSYVKVVEGEDGQRTINELGYSPRYKQTKISKSNIEKILGEDATLEVFDNSGNLLFIINKETQYDENGEFIYTYEDEAQVSGITIKTSQIQNIGMLDIQTTKEIQATMNDLEGTSVRNQLQVKGINEKEEIVTNEDGTQSIKTAEEEKTEVKGQKINEIKDSITKVDLSIDNTNWSNETQNEVAFEANLDSSKIQYNLFRNPTIKIELPSQVEKVVLGESQLTNGNGLTLANTQVIQEDGNLSILVSLEGVQTQYSLNDLNLGTNIKIPAKVILKKDIENAIESVNMSYTNQVNLDGSNQTGNEEKVVTIVKYSGEDEQENSAVGGITTQIVDEAIKEVAKNILVEASAEETEGISLAVEPTKADGTTLRDGDTLYEGEFIKYTVKVQNTTDKTINNVSAIATIPDGMITGELESNFHYTQEEFEGRIEENEADNVYLNRKYKYNFDETATQKEINIGSVKPGETVTKTYEVFVKDLSDGETQKQVTKEVSAYIGSTKATTVTMNNTIKSSTSKVFLWSKPIGQNHWEYGMNVNVEEGKTATITLNLPEEIEIPQDQIDEQIATVVAFKGDYATQEQGMEKSTTANADELIKDFTSEISSNKVTITTSTSGIYKFDFKTEDKTKIINSSSNGKAELTAYATATVDNETYLSNENRTIYEYDNVEVSMTSPTEGETVKYEDEIDYNIKVECTGTSNVAMSADGVCVNILDYIPQNVTPVSITYEYYELEETKKDVEVETEDGTQTVTQVSSKFSEKQTKTEEINYSSSDENGTNLPDSDIYTWIPRGESINILLKTTAGYVYETTEVRNSAVVKAATADSTEESQSTTELKTKTSNIVKHTILGQGTIEDEDPSDPSNPDDPSNPSDPTNPDNPDDPNNSDGQKVSISGLAWNDENQDGIRQEGETILKDVEVLLVDTKNQSSLKSSTTTNTGNYTFANLDPGSYIVIFKYDTSKYKPTSYRVDGSTQYNNSDANAQTITLDNQSMDVALTDTIEASSSVSNIDIGLIETQGAKLKIDKYIEEVTVKTSKGTKQNKYNNSQLAKVDIRAKEIQGAVVTVKYKIVVTNEGTVAKSIKSITDNMPDGLEFASSGNTGWEKSNNTLTNRSLMNTNIAAGESKEVYLTLTKTMNSEDTGTFTNIARVTGETNNSQAQLIISVSTGLAVYISIGIVTLIAIGLLVFCSIKFKWRISKITKTSLSIMAVLLLGTSIFRSEVEAAAPPTATFVPWNVAYCVYFTGGPTGLGICNEGTSRIAQGDPFTQCPHGSAYYHSYDFNKSTTLGEKQTVESAISLEKTNSKIGVKLLNGNYILGPFTSKSNSTNEYSITVVDKTDNVITGWNACDANGNNVGKVYGSSNKTFYLKLSSSLYERGVAKVSVTQHKTYKYKQSYTTTGQSVYIPAYYSTPCNGYSGHQSVHTTVYTIDQGTKEGSQDTHKTIEWTDFNSSLDIVKEDADNSDIKLNIEGTISLKGSSWSQSFKTSGGKVHFDNLQAGTYVIKETVNNTYGYEGQVSKQVELTVRSGSSYTFKFKNAKQTGNLELYKKDANSGKKLANIGFKVKTQSGGYIVAVDKNGKEQKEVTGSVELSKLKTTTDKNSGTLFKTDSNGSCIIYNIRVGTYVVEEAYIGSENYGYDLDDNYITWSTSSGSGKGRTATVNVTREASYNTSLSNSIIKDSKKTINDGIYEFETGVSSSYALDLYSSNTYNKANIAIYQKNKSLTQQFYVRYLGNGKYRIEPVITNKVVEAFGGAKENGNVSIYTNNGSVAQQWQFESVGNGYYKIRSGTTNYYMDVKDGKAQNNQNVQVHSSNNSTAQRFKINTLTNVAANRKATTTVLTYMDKRKYIKLSGHVWEDMVSGKTSTRDNLYNSDEEKNDKLVANVTVRLKDKDGNNVKFKTESGEEVTQIKTDSNGSYKMVDIQIDKLKDYYIEFEYNGMSYQSVLPNLSNSAGSKATDEKSRSEFNNNFATITNNTSSDKNGNKTYDLRYESKDNTSTLIYGDNPQYGYDGQRFPVANVDEQYTITANTKDAYLSDTGANNSGYLTDMYDENTIRNNGIEEIGNINLGLYEREMPDLALVEDVYTTKLTLNGYEHTYKYDQRFSNTEETGDGFNVAVKFENKYGSASYTREVYSSDIVYNMQDGNNGKLQAYITYKIAVKNEATNVYTTVNNIVNYYDSRYEINSIKDESGNSLSYNVDSSYDSDGYKRVIINAEQKIAPQTQKYVYVEYKLNNDAVNAILNEDITLKSVSEVEKYSSYSDEAYSVSYAGIDKDSNPGTAEPTNRETYEDDTDAAPSFILKVKEARVVKGTIFEDNALEELLAKSGYDKERKGNGIFDSNENVIKNVKVELLEIADDGSYQVATLYKKDKSTQSASVTTKEDGSYEFSGMIPGNYVVKYIYGDTSVICDQSGNVISEITAEDYKSTIYRGGDSSKVGSSDGLWYREETGNATRLSDARDMTGTFEDGNVVDIVEYRNTSRELNNKTVEYEKSLSTITSQTETFTIRMDYDVNLDNISEFGADLKFIFDNIDLGIIRRPEQKIEVSKTINYVKVTLANGQVIIDGNPADGLQYVKLLPDGNIHIEIDSELMQSANVEITYGMTVDNRKAEIDYNDANYYIFGTVPSNKESKWRMATVTRLFEYLSNELTFDENAEVNQNWKVALDAFGLNSSSQNKLLEDGYLTEDAYKAFKKYNNVFQTEAFKDMKPGETKTVEMKVTKLLANTQDDMIYGNDIEVNGIKDEPIKDSTPGNYVPVDGVTTGEPDEVDNDNKYVTITVPTGEDKNFIPYIIIGISGFIILAAGIVFIKKKIL